MSNGYIGLQISLKDSRGALLNITGATPTELAANYGALSQLEVFADFFTLTAPQVQAALAPLAEAAPVAAAPAPVAAAKSVQQPNAPASEKQIALIRKKGGTVAEGLTKGQASAIIDTLIKKG